MRGGRPKIAPAHILRTAFGRPMARPVVMSNIPEIYCFQRAIMSPQVYTRASKTVIQKSISPAGLDSRRESRIISMTSPRDRIRKI